MTPRRLLAAVIWAAALIIWADALAPGSPVADLTSPRHTSTLTR